MAKGDKLVEKKVIDVLIAGGGPGGLSAALVLGRALKKVAVIDDGKARNQVTKASHGFLTRDGVDPVDLKQIAHEQMKKYANVEVRKDTVTSVENINGLFVTATKSGKVYESKKIIFSTGMKDHLPEIPGLQDVYGKTVFHCPYCDGWERRGEPLAVFGNGEKVMSFVKVVLNWSRDLIVFTNGKADLTKEDKEELRERGISLIETPISFFRSENGRLSSIQLTDGTSIERTGGFLMQTGEKQSSFLPAELGVPLNEKGEFETQEHGQTEIEGLFVIGDAKNTFVSVAGAVGQGYEAGVKINGIFAEEMWEQER